jgi:hypothetical protein
MNRGRYTPFLNKIEDMTAASATASRSRMQMQWPYSGGASGTVLKII